MHFTKKSSLEKRLDFVKKLKLNKLLRFPGAYNPLCAKLIEEIDLMASIFLGVLCLTI